ncbi:MAG TPA: phosphoribosyl-ATP diphosphatase [Methanospirillum sp.]|nr:phosphoribosyl-ATP diphosphatase [Methanospirillum sp.]
MKSAAILDEIWDVISDRAEHPVEGSYTTHILSHRKGIDKSLEKVGEESSEFIISVKNREKAAIIGEAADLFFHMLLALKAADVDLSAVYAELESRRKS